MSNCSTLFRGAEMCSRPHCIGVGNVWFVCLLMSAERLPLCLLESGVAYVSLSHTHPGQSVSLSLGQSMGKANQFYVAPWPTFSNHVSWCWEWCIDIIDAIDIAYARAFHELAGLNCGLITVAVNNIHHLPWPVRSDWTLALSYGILPIYVE